MIFLYRSVGFANQDGRGHSRKGLFLFCDLPMTGLIATDSNDYAISL